MVIIPLAFIPHRNEKYLLRSSSTFLQAYLGKGVKIVKEDPKLGLLALNKPINVLSHPNVSDKYQNSLIKAPYDTKNECYIITSQGINHKVWLLHRLDYSTSGLILISIAEETSQFVKKCFSDGSVKKKYIALVYGKLNNKNQTWENYINSPKLINNSFKSTNNRGSYAKTKVNMMKFDGVSNISAIELYPYTGLTHQLRIQCHDNNLPIIGDRLHGNFKVNKKILGGKYKNRLYLHSNELKIDFKNFVRDSIFLNDANYSSIFHCILPIPDEFRKLITFNSLL